MIIARNSMPPPVVLALIILLAGCGSHEPAAKKAAVPQQSDSLTIEINGRDGASVLELTMEKHSVESYESAMGTFVRAIDSVASGNGYWWLFTVNDSTVNTASDKYITKKGDLIKWHFRKP